MEIVSWQCIPEEQLNDGITRKMFWGENVMVVKWWFPPETSLPVHDHVSEQVTMVQRGALTLIFPGEGKAVVREGEILVIKPSKPHGVKVGPAGCSVVDLFSPVRRDFIDATAVHASKSGEVASEKAQETPVPAMDPYEELQGFLTAAGVKVPLEKLKEMPLELLARYVYERECITMGQLRKILRIDRTAAKEMLRQWKHGDDHSESSLKRKLERLIVLPTDLRRT